MEMNPGEIADEREGWMQFSEVTACMSSQDSSVGTATG
jgi:hypothetical protein